MQLKLTPSYILRAPLSRSSTRPSDTWYRELPSIRRTWFLLVHLKTRSRPKGKGREEEKKVEGAGGLGERKEGKEGLLMQMATALFQGSRMEARGQRRWFLMASSLCRFIAMVSIATEALVTCERRRNLRRPCSRSSTRSGGKPSRNLLGGRGQGKRRPMGVSLQRPLRRIRRVCVLLCSGSTGCKTRSTR